MAEKNYIMQAVVPEAPRTIDEQQLHVYVPQGSTDNFGVFKPDGQQFVITEDGILRVDASKLIQLATPSAQVIEDGGETSAEVQFTETDHTLLRQFQFIFKNIKGPIGATGLAALECSYVKTANKQPSLTEQINIPLNTFNRTPLSGEVATCYYVDSTTSITYLIKAGIISISGDHAICYIDSVLRFTGDKGADGLDALTYSGTYTEEREGGLNGEPINLPLANFSRHPEMAETFLLVYSVTETGNVYIAVMSVEEVGTENVKCALVVGTVNLIRGPKGEQGEKGATGNDGVSITSVTQTGVQGGTLVTITLSNGQSTSFTVYNGINTNFQIVDSLPTENISTSTIYLVPSTKPEAENIYDEYIYVNNKWEHIGSTSIDLSDYVTKTFFDQNVGNATKNYIDAQLSGKADASALNAKLDKVTDGSMLPQAYVKNDDGTQGMADYIPGVFYFNYSGVLNLDNFDDVTITEGWNPSLTGMYYCVSPCILSIGQLTGGVLGGTTMWGVNLSSTRTYDLSSVYFQGIARKATETGYEYYNVVVQVDSSGMILYATAQKIENAGNKVTAITGTGNDTNYPTTKAVADYVTSKEPYHFTYEWGTVLTAEQKAGIQNDPECYFYATNDEGVTVKYKRSGVEGNRYYFMSMHAYTQYEAGGLINVGQVFVDITAQNDVIETEEIYAENPKNKTDVLNAQSTDDQYPTAKAVFDYVTSKEQYHVELTGASGTLSVEQYNKLKADDNSYILISPTDVSTQKNKFYRQEVAGSILTYCSENLLDSARITILSDRTWTIEEAAAENQSNKTTTLSASSTNIQYPTAKATYDADQATLTAANNHTDTAIANAITTTLNTPV